MNKEKLVKIIQELLKTGRRARFPYGTEKGRPGKTGCLHQGRDLPVREKITIFYCVVQNIFRAAAGMTGFAADEKPLVSALPGAGALHPLRLQDLKACGAARTVADSAIAADVRARIAEDGLPPVRVFVLDGRVTLSGSVPSQEIRQKMIAAAKSVKGVSLVTPDLQLQKIR